jgi:hypothetical protein
MFRRVIAAQYLMLLLAACGLAAVPSTRPSTTSQPAANEPLAGGAIRYAPPPGWKLVKKSDDGLTATYNSPDQFSEMLIGVTPEKVAVTDSVKPQMAKIITDSIRKKVTEQNGEMLYGPKAEKDDRFYLRIHDRCRLEDSISDRVQMFKVAGLNLVLVSVVARNATDEHAKEIHKIGEDVLESAHAARTPAPQIFGRSKLKMTPPLDWKMEKSDAPNGLTAMFKSEADPQLQIIVKSKIVPKDAQQSEQRQKNLIAQMIDADRSSPPIKGAKRTGDSEFAGDSKAIRSIRVTYETSAGTMLADSRFVLVGDTMVAVTSIAPPAKADDVKQVTDSLIETIKPAGK